MFEIRKKKTDTGSRESSQIYSQKREAMQKSNNNIVHSCPLIVQYCNTLGNYRPRFSSGFRTDLPVNKGQARRHIISYEVIRSAFIRVLNTNDSSFNEMAEAFISNQGRQPNGTSKEALAMGCLQILNENPKNFVVDDFKVNSALGNILKQINSVIMSGAYQEWPDGITGSQAIDNCITPTNGSSVDAIINNLKDAVGRSVLNNNKDKLDFLHLVYDNMSLDIMNKNLQQDELSNMRSMFEQRLYQGFISANDAQSLFEVCYNFMGN